MKSFDIFPGFKTYGILIISLINYLESNWPQIVEGVGLIQAGVAVLLTVIAGLTKRMADVRNNNGN